MKNTSLSFLLIIIFSVFFSCKNDQKKAITNTNDLLTAQNLGYAYLEEFKLEEAENEFLRVIELTPNEESGYANLGLTYLRMGKYEAAEIELLKAIEIAPEDADIHLLLATVYEMDHKSEEAITTLKNTLKFDPTHVKTLYDLTELLAVKTDEQSIDERKNYLIELVNNAPENIVPKLNLTEIFIKQGENDKAIEQLEIIQKQFPEFPKEAVQYFDETIQLLRKPDNENVFIQFTIFNNYQKVSFPYQAGIKDLKGPGGSLVGFPLITYSQQPVQSTENKSLLDILKFTEISAAIGLDIVSVSNDEIPEKYKNTTHITSADYDGDGDVDFYVGSYDTATSTYKHYLFNSDMVTYTDISKEAGLTHSGLESSAIFADYDNDGYLDLYIVREDGDLLYRNAGKGSFEDVTDDAGLNNTSKGRKALFLDVDHDGDLDIFKISENSNVVYRNNGDGTFIEMSKKMNLNGGANANSVDVAFGDFDEDGDLDIITLSEAGKISLYSNQRQGIFKNISKGSGLIQNAKSKALSVADFNNDGFLDVLVVGIKGSKSSLFKNLGDGKFEEIIAFKKIINSLENVEAFDTEFFDFDNDGFLDILISGVVNDASKKGLTLLHNEGTETFTDVSNLLPENPNSGNQLSLFDYNDDGDLDVLIANPKGGVSLLRNDGGSMNHFVKMKLVGLRTGSAKNNFYGIGAKVEMRAGDLYQTTVVTSPTVYFGLGNRAKADIIRITWTNGVPQNILLPDSDQTLIESQTLKGSCPFLYTWNGEKYVFVKDITWRSALGMPLGIMGGETIHGFADASDDYIKIPGELLKPINNEYSIQVTSELWETIYMDKIELVAVDHPDSIDVFVPEQFSPPPFPGMDIYQVHKKQAPISALNSDGENVLPLIIEKDDKYISDFKPEKFQGTTKVHNLILDPGETGNHNELLLYLNGWIFPTDASINVALSQSEALQVFPPIIQVINKKGEWETVDRNVGFPMGKDKTVIVNLSGKFLTKDHRVRIQTNMEIYWDYIFFSSERPNTPINTTVLNPISADIHYRGFSKTYKKGGRYGPHWFDYYNVDTNKKWRDLTGNYTRYGDVSPLLTASDNKYIISNAGDETSIKFSAASLPKLKKGWKRDFLIRSVGWVKDGDLNTALGSTVLPLPFHGMESYPPSKNDIYPQDITLEKYLKEYNTREVTMDDYRNSIKNK